MYWIPFLSIWGYIGYVIIIQDWNHGHFMCQIPKCDWKITIQVDCRLIDQNKRPKLPNGPKRFGDTKTSQRQLLDGQNFLTAQLLDSTPTSKAVAMSSLPGGLAERVEKLVFFLAPFQQTVRVFLMTHAHDKTWQTTCVLLQ